MRQGDVNGPQWPSLKGVSDCLIDPLIDRPIDRISTASRPHRRRFYAKRGGRQ